MLDISPSGRVHLETLMAEQHDMGVRDAVEHAGPRREPPPVNARRPPKLAGINSPTPPPQHTGPPSAASRGQSAPARPRPAGDLPDGPGPDPLRGPGPARPVEHLAAVQDRLAGWLSDLTTLHGLTERLLRTATLESAVHEVLRTGAALAGARRGLLSLAPADPAEHPGPPAGRPRGVGPGTTVGLGLGVADLGQIETVPRGPGPFALLSPEPLEPAAGDGPAGPREVVLPHIGRDTRLGPRHREVAARLGCAASYAVALETGTAGQVGAAVWFYDEPARPTERRRHLLRLYARQAAEHLARQLDLARARDALDTVREGLLPGRLPRVPGARLAARHRTGPCGGGDWYDALPLPDGGLALSVGTVTGSGPDATAVTGRLRAALRAYAVLEGEDPVAVLSDLEVLLRLTEPARAATVLFGYAEPAASGSAAAAGGARIVLAGAGHCPPLVVGPRRTEFAETALSAPLGMLTCWEAPSVELELAAGETLLLYSDGLLRRTGEPLDRAVDLLRSAAEHAAPAVRDDPGALADHLLRALAPGGTGETGAAEDAVLLVARF
ncbi:SpoIIE family protein phosphatase [Streptomyces sp. TRM 70361]|uniref:PP2C family protein-serine/threonine phosphatase n=1 Tax=Streptomyces sp. TRM 70361 TaxID=3116553 RepID=UPI002E7AED97|nr:SpoIIE family protein phosphatase [Streptomyces sp. TRM 70361]MEE1939640.1 SpoIIE family protein phosphatase [Streptomyces sp. TRM 70361]